MSTIMSADIHPMEEGRVIIPNRSLDRLAKSLSTMIAYQVPSAVITGERRKGKTTAIRYIQNHPVETLGKDYPIFVHRCKHHPRYLSEGTFWSELLFSSNHPLAVSGSPKVKFSRLVNRLIAEGKSKPYRRLITILDEANRLTADEYNWLIDLHNEVVEGGIDVYCFLVGQPELALRRDEFQVENAKQIVGRFMAHQLTFTGLMSVDEVEYSLSAFDRELTWPNQEMPYTRYFALAPFDSGWRLASQAPLFWKVFSRPGGGFDTNEGLSLQTFASVVSFMLRVHAKNEKAFRGFTEDQVLTAVKNLSYLEVSDEAD